MFAVPFLKDFNYLNDPQIQFNINYEPHIKNLINFFQVYGNHNINIVIPLFKSQQDMRELLKITNILKEKFPDTYFTICFSFEYSKLDIKKWKPKINAPVYTNKIITSFDDFNDLLEIGVSDIFIGNILGFYIKPLFVKAKAYNVKLRAYCNFCQSTSITEPSFKNFFIRPEDIPIYSKYISVFEFAPDTNINTYYQIYAKDQQWFGLLKELIIGYNHDENIDNRTISPFLAERRCSCYKKCAYQFPVSCNICDIEMELNDTLNKKGIIPVLNKTD